MCQFALFNLPIFVDIFFVTFACHFEYRVYWHAKSLQSKSIAKIGSLNLHKKAVSKFADLVRVHKNKWTLMQTKCSAHTAWLL